MIAASPKHRTIPPMKLSALKPPDPDFGNVDMVVTSVEVSALVLDVYVWLPSVEVTSVVVIFSSGVCVVTGSGSVPLLDVVMSVILMEDVVTVLFVVESVVLLFWELVKGVSTATQNASATINCIFNFK